ncbi:adenosylcobinamide-phosphate synthase CbiB [Vulcanococcus sp.]|jgi:adenosylcobinamide-phosphate synthase|uniref:adenosylcobinamide-phosphate synthase CbiB n=1 Tax=Vulcanococcus sp. TaxID=2856995 RepID=UPI0037D9D6F3
MTLLLSGVDSFTGIHPFLLVLAAAGLDRLVGDPRWCLHPVVVMGWWIRRLQQLSERWAGDRPWALRLAGGVITALLVGGSGGAGWLLEQWALGRGLSDLRPAGLLALWIALTSALAGRSLEQAVRSVLQALPDVAAARTALSWIVGRDTTELNQAEIVRAAAETASENAVDGLFAPLFWMLVGAGLWSVGYGGAPGPLALAWGFKAASTLDSMLGYRQGTLLWLGTAGARLDDLLVWLPCRLVALSLPLATGCGPGGCLQGLVAALRDGVPDPSPNAGVSQAAYAHAAGVQLGGLNRYGDQLKVKPLLAAGSPRPNPAAVERMLRLSLRLELLWLLAGLALGIAISAVGSVQ